MSWCRLSPLTRPTLLSFALACLALNVGHTASGKELLLVHGAYRPATEPLALITEWSITEDSSRLWVVQFEGRVTEEAHRLLAKQGVTVLDYLPEDALLVDRRECSVQGLRSVAGVLWAGAWQPYFRVAPELHSAIATFTEETAPRELLLEIAETQNVHVVARELAKRYTAAGLKVLHVTDHEAQQSLVLSAPLSLVRAIAAEEGVLWVQEAPVYELFNNNITWVSQSNVRDSKPLWDRGLKGQGQIVGILDSGLDYGSCFFRDPDGLPPGPQHRKVLNYRSYGGDLFDGCFPLGHGTHVAGTLAGNDLNNPNNPHNGVAPEAKLTVGDFMGFDLLTCGLGLSSFSGSPITALSDAKRDGAGVHSNSWGTNQNAYDAAAAGMDSFANSNPEMTILFANGNSGPNARTVGTPATAKNVISVGAGRQPPVQNQVAQFSSRGPTTDGRYKPTVVMIGDEVTSAKNSQGQSIQESCEAVNKFEIFGFTSPISGTSMACPAVAGIATLVRQYYMEGFYPGGERNPANGFTPTSALVRATIINSAQPLSFSPRPDNNQGWGLVVIDEALYFAGDGQKLHVFDNRFGVKNGQEQSYSARLKGNGSLFVTLVWTDPAGSAASGKNLVNNLDLKVTAPDGSTVYWGNNFASNFSTAGEVKDDLNTEENVFLNTAGAGNYLITVVGQNVPMAPQGQGYALVVRGAEEVVVPDNNPPGKATNLFAADLPDDIGGRLQLSWNLSPDDGGGENDVVGYAILREEVDNPGFQLVEQVPPRSRQYIDATVRNRVAYRYMVRTIDGFGLSSDSDPSREITAIAQRPVAKVYMAGYMNTSISTEEGGTLKILAWVQPATGATVTGLKLWYLGLDTGVILTDGNNDRFYEWTYALPPGIGPGELLFELQPLTASDVGPTWPWLNVTP